MEKFTKKNKRTEEWKFLTDYRIPGKIPGHAGSVAGYRGSLPALLSARDTLEYGGRGWQGRGRVAPNLAPVVVPPEVGLVVELGRLLELLARALVPGALGVLRLLLATAAAVHDVARSSPGAFFAFFKNYHCRQMHDIFFGRLN